MEIKEIETLNYHKWLAEEFSVRMKRNPRFSMRAFALLLKMDSSTISQIMNGKRKISHKLISRITDILGATPEQKKLLINFTKKNSKKNNSKILDPEPLSDFFHISQDMMAVISEWHHYALLELTFIQDFQSKAAWIGRKLGLSAAQAQLAINRLLRLGLLQEKNGVLVKSKKFTTNFKSGETSDLLRQFQKQVIKKALDAIDDAHPDEKDITAMTMAIDETKLPDARELIKKFRRNLSQYLEKGTPTRVYNLAIQLYPLSKRNMK